MDSICFCKISKLNKAISLLEQSLTEMYGLTLNEAIAMCSLRNSRLSAGELAEATGIKSSHLSKVLRSIECKGLLTREFGSDDRRMIYFSLTGKGNKMIEAIMREGPKVPEILQCFLKCYD